LVNWAFGSTGKTDAVEEAPPYEEAKHITEAGTEAEKAALAARANVPPEFLYYFATTGSSDVKAAVAENPSTPLQADMVLVADNDEIVREKLAGKIGNKAAHVDPDGDAKSTKMVHQLLDSLAKDQLPAIRGIISDAIKSLDNVPKPIVSLLAKDVDDLVASPILEFSPLLSDAELVQIVGGAGTTALTAVARRNELGASVSDAVASTGDTDAIVTLLQNETANIEDTTFDRIAELAADQEQLHAPMVGRGDLPSETIRKVAGFVSDTLLEQLTSRNDLDDSLRDEIRSKIEERLNGSASNDLDDSLRDEIRSKIEERLNGSASNDSGIELNNSQSIAEAHEEFRKGRVPAHRIMRRLNGGDFSFVVAVITLMSGIRHESLANAILQNNAQAVVSAAWKSGLDPYLTETIQKKIPTISSANVLPPSDSGGFPLSNEKMEAILRAL